MTPDGAEAFRFLVMAAGESKRFGGCKLLANYQGIPLIEHCLRSVAEVSLHPVTLVTGAYHDAINAYLNQRSDLRLNMHFYPDWSLGLGSSIAFGVQQLDQSPSIVVVLADQPLLMKGDFQRILAVAMQAPERVVCARHGKSLGPPTVFPGSMRDKLSALTGASGAKQVLMALRNQAIVLDMPNACFDIDTPEDLARLTYPNI